MSHQLYSFSTSTVANQTQANAIGLDAIASEAIQILALGGFVNPGAAWTSNKDFYVYNTTSGAVLATLTISLSDISGGLTTTSGQAILKTLPTPVTIAAGTPISICCGGYGSDLTYNASGPNSTLTSDLGGGLVSLAGTGRYTFYPDVFPSYTNASGYGPVPYDGPTLIYQVAPGPGPAISPPTATLYQGETITLAATNFTAGTVTWASSDTTLATVNSSGVVAPLAKAGTATITATGVAVTSETATATITVSLSAPPAKPAIGALTTGYSTYALAAPLSEGVGPACNLVTGDLSAPIGPSCPPSWTTTGFNPPGYLAGPSLQCAQGDAGIVFLGVPIGSNYPRMTAIAFSHSFPSTPTVCQGAIAPLLTSDRINQGAAYQSNGFGFNFAAASVSDQWNLSGFGWQATNGSVEPIGSVVPTAGQWYLAVCLETSNTTREYWLYGYTEGRYLASAQASTTGTAAFTPTSVFAVNPGFFLTNTRSYVGQIGCVVVDNDTYSTDGTGSGVNKSVNALVTDMFVAMRGTYTSSSGTPSTLNPPTAGSSPTYNPITAQGGVGRVDAGCPLVFGGTTPYSYQWYDLPTPVTTPGPGTAITGATSRTYAKLSASSTATTFLACVITDAASHSYTVLMAPARALSGLERHAFGGNSIAGNGVYADYAGLGLRFGIRCSGIFAGVGGSTSSDWNPTNANGRWVAFLAEAVSAGCTDIGMWMGENDGVAATLATDMAAMADSAAAHGIRVWFDGPVLPQRYIGYDVLSAMVPDVTALQSAHPNLYLGDTTAIGWTACDRSYTSDGYLHPNQWSNAALVLDVWNSRHPSLAGGGTVPAASDTRYGIAVGSGTGTCHVPTVAQVLAGIAVDAGAGTVVLPVASTVETGTAYGPGGSLVGTYAGSGGGGSVTDSSVQSDVTAAMIALGFTSALATQIGANLNATVSSRSTLSGPAYFAALAINPSTGGVRIDGSKMPLIRSQTGVTNPTYDDCLIAAHSLACGEETKSIGAGGALTVLTLDTAAGGTLIVSDLDNATIPTTRTPRSS